LPFDRPKGWEGNKMMHPAKASETSDFRPALFSRRRWHWRLSLLSRSTAAREATVAAVIPPAGTPVLAIPGAVIPVRGAVIPGVAILLVTFWACMATMHKGPEWFFAARS
jgi:hypothetical protein